MSVESYLDTPPADTPAAATAAPTTGSSKNYQADLLANLQSWIAHYSDTNHNASAVLPPNQPITTTSFSRGAAQLIPKLGASASTHPPHPLSTLPLSFPAASSSSTAGSTTIKKSSATNTSSDTRKTRSNNAGSTSSTTLSSKTHQQATIAKPPAKRARTTASGSSSNAQPVGEVSMLKREISLYN